MLNVTEEALKGDGKALKDEEKNIGGPKSIEGQWETINGDGEALKDHGEAFFYSICLLIAL